MHFFPIFFFLLIPKEKFLRSKIKAWVTKKEKRQGKWQVFSNWHLLKTTHQFKHLNHAEEKVTLILPLSHRCSDILPHSLHLSHPLPPAYFFFLPLSAPLQLSFFFLTHKKFLIVFPHLLKRKRMSKQYFISCQTEYLLLISPQEI